MELSYVNKKGAIVRVATTRHAIARFTRRWRAVAPDDPRPVTEVLVEMFGRATRVLSLGSAYRKRMKRHGADTVYLRCDPFVFVVQACTLVTAELATADTRRLNKRAPLIRPTAQPVVPQPMRVARPPAKADSLKPGWVMVASTEVAGQTKHFSLGRYISAYAEEERTKLQDDPEIVRVAGQRWAAMNRVGVLRAVLLYKRREDTPVIVLVS